MIFRIFFFIVIIGGNVFAQTQKNAAVLDSLNRVLLSSTENKDRVITMTALCNVYSTINFDSANMYGQAALRLAEQKNLISEKVLALSYLGIAHTRNGDMAQALQLQFSALKIAQDYQLDKATAISSHSIAKSYQFLKDNANAIKYAKQARLIFQNIQRKPFRGYPPFYLWKNGSESTYSSNELVIGEAFLNSNQLDSALFILEQLSSEATNSYWSNVLNVFLGETYFKLGEQETGLKVIAKVVQGSTRVEDPYLRSWAYSKLSQCFSQLNQTDSVIHYAKLGLADAQKVGFKDRILQSSRLLATAYEDSDLAESHRYLKMASEINDDIFGPEKVFSLQRTLAQQQQLILEAEKAQIAYKSEIKQYALGLGLIIIVLIALTLYRNNRQKQQANVVLQQQKSKIENTLSQLKSAQTQLIHSEKMASLGELTAGIAHEIQNPLNFVNNFSEVSSELVDEIKEEMKDGNMDEVENITADLKQNLEKINHHGQRASGIVKGMLEHSRTGSGEKDLTDINKLADEYLRLSYHGLRAKDKSFNADFKTDFDESLPKVQVITQDLGRVILNLINNAFYASSTRALAEVGSDYKPIVTVATRKIGDKIEISVKDNGAGIPEDIKEKIFQPFFTTKPTGSGTGL